MPYRKDAPRSTDLETAAIHDLLARMKRLRRRAALPTLIAAACLAWLGATAHALGYWPVFGRLQDGSYFVGTASLLIVASLCGLPVALPGAVLYVVLRGRLRTAWREEYRRMSVADEWTDRDEWLERTSRRFQ